VYELTFFYAVILVLVGVVAGVINTLAGGGSNLTLPALMVMGMPADVANATNRVGVLLQSLAGANDFHRGGHLPREDFGAILLLTLLGSLIGALLAAFMPASILKPVLLSAMLGMALLILVRPAVVAPPPGTVPRRVADTPSSKWILLLAGVYGGFVQAGVGFILIAALAGSLRYELVKTNALKMLCTGCLTLAAIAVFIWQDLIAWVPGLILAVGTVIGAKLGVKLAVGFSQNGLKWFLFIMTLLASAAALWF
jgi:uncharacterized membrane protein YfcA